MSNPNQSGPRQDRLIEFCRTNGLGNPNFQLVSDRRGGRTAWSSQVTIQGQVYSARFWYDGEYTNNAREDASTIALEVFGQIKPTGVSPAQQMQHQRGPNNGNGQGNGGGGQR